MMTARNHHYQKQLSELLMGFIDKPIATEQDVVVNGLCLDSRKVSAGDLFLACPGQGTHGANYISAAVKAGAVAILYDADYSLELPKIAIPLISIDDLQRKVGEIAHCFYQYPSNDLKVIGVTGTNGKTSITWFLANMMHEETKPVGMIGTLGIGVIGAIEKNNNTTPDPISIHAALSEFKQQDIEYVVMEVSSHALEQSRIAAVNFETVIFTNLSHEHLDYHGSMQNYFAVKKRLFTDYDSKYKIINIDDEYGENIAEQLTTDVFTYSLKNKSLSENAIYANNIELKNKTISFDIACPWGNAVIETQLLGEFNIYNLLACISVLCLNGLSLDDVVESIKTLTNVPGRMECFGEEDTAIIVVDYAHTPDALENVLKSLKKLTTGHLFCVFGCGGDRDKAKRSQMGAIAAEYANAIVLTNDNPRSEDPMMIIDEIKKGIPDSQSVYVELDRAEAISHTLALSSSDDVVLIAGKGHEDYQIIGDQTLVFDDRVWIKRFLESKGD